MAAGRTTSDTPRSAERSIPPRGELLLDHYLPEFDEFEHHSIHVNAAPEVAYQAVLTAPLGASPWVRMLLRLRQLPSVLVRRSCEKSPDAEIATVLDLIGHGFFLVDEHPGREIVLGKSGEFWRPLDGGKAGGADDLQAPLAPGTALALWNFRVARQAHGSVIHTETRVRCADSGARRRFRFYWLLIGPFSGFIRRQMLESIRYQAESTRP